MYAGQQQVLSELQKSIENRLALQQPLAMLSGRLDLLLAQTLTRKEGGDGSYQVASPTDIQVQLTLFTWRLILRLFFLTSIS